MRNEECGITIDNVAHRSMNIARFQSREISIFGFRYSALIGSGRFRYRL